MPIQPLLVSNSFTGAIITSSSSGVSGKDTWAGFRFRYVHSSAMHFPTSVDGRAKSAANLLIGYVSRGVRFIPGPKVIVVQAARSVLPLHTLMQVFLVTMKSGCKTSDHRSRATTRSLCLAENFAMFRGRSAAEQYTLSVFRHGSKRC